MKDVFVWSREQLPRLVLLFSAAGFALLLIELFFVGHTQGEQLLGVVAAMAGLLAALASFGVRRRTTLVALLGVLLLVAMLGVFGTAQHLEPAEESEIRQTASSTPPPLAPLSVAGLAALAALALMAERGEVFTRR